jgi:hypothetical protein
VRREIPVVITFVVGVIMLLSNFISVPMGSYSLAGLAQEMGTWVILISAFAVGLASVNLVRIHGRNLSSAKSRFNSALLLCALFIWALVGIIQFHASDSAFWTDLNQQMYNSVLSPLSAAMFALIAFYLGSAAYRVFRARSMDATILLIACVLMMLGQAPIGALIWNKFPAVSGWLLEVPNNVGQRAIMMGAAIGAFATSLRILFGIERGHFGAD